MPFWETVLDRPADDMKTQMTMASHFVKINSVFMTKKPVEVGLVLFYCEPSSQRATSDARLYSVAAQRR